MNSKVLKINFKDGKSIELELGKIVHSDTKKDMIYFDKVADGKWRAIVNKNMISNFSEIDNFEFLR